jgi:hypothetical protein
VQDLSKYYDYGIREQIQYLLSYVGEGMNVCYSKGGSGTTIIEAQKYLHKLGYKAEIEDYSYEKVVSHLNEMHPLFIQGIDSIGHAWVTDGYIENSVRRQDDLTYVVITSNTVNYGEPPLFVKETAVSTQNAKYLHFNWGDGPNCNGYYLKDIFKVKDRYVIDNENFAKLTKDEVSSSFDFCNKVKILNIYR